MRSSSTKGNSQEIVRNGNWPGVILAAAAVICLLLPQASFAAWSTSADENIAVTSALGFQGRPQVIYDGDGGYFATWRDYETPGVFAQHYDVLGDAMWGEAGALVCSENNSQVEGVSDGAGGVIVTWSENSDTYAQHLDADGAPLWEVDGIPVLLGDSDTWIAPDGQGGVIVMGYYGHVNRVDYNGNLLWGAADDAPLYTETGNAWAPKIVSDGRGGAVLAWMDDDSDGNDVVCVQRVDADGDFLWNGGEPLVISTGSGNYAGCPRLTSSGNGGAFVVWYEEPDGYEIRGQGIDADGDIQWADGGVVVASAGSIYTDSLDLAGNGRGGAFFTWADSDDYTLYAQYVDASGDPVWDDPLAMSVEGEFSDVAQHTRKTVEDGRGGFITAWYNDSDQVKAQRCGADGIALWGDGGAVLSNGTSIYYGPKLASNGQGGAVAIWVDDRSDDPDTGQNIYLQGIDADGKLGDPGYTDQGRDVHHHSCLIDASQSPANPWAGFLLLAAACACVLSFVRREAR